MKTRLCSIPLIRLNREYSSCLVTKCSTRAFLQMIQMSLEGANAVTSPRAPSVCSDKLYPNVMGDATWRVPHEPSKPDGVGSRRIVEADSVRREPVFNPERYGVKNPC